MDSQEDLSGCCFRCPELASHNNTTCSVIQYSKPTHLQNAWPELAANKLTTIRTSPYIRTTYFPVYHKYMGKPPEQIYKLTENNKTRFIEEAADNLDQIYTILHEYMHFHYLDWSPAKDLTRLLLARCYDIILDWLGMDSLSDRQTFEALTQQLTGVTQNISFVEELFADALAIYMMKDGILTGKMWSGYGELLPGLEERVLRQQEQSLNNFRNMYHLIQPLIEKLIHDFSNTEYIIPLLQAVKNEGGSIPRAIDSYENLNLLLEIFRDKTTEDILQAKIDECLAGWNAVSSLLLQQPYDSPSINFLSESLWYIAHGNLRAEIINPRAQTIPSRWSADRGIGACLTPRVSNTGQVFIALILSNGSLSEGSYSSLLLDYLLFFEGLRQQLITKKGIICPFYESDGCCDCPLEVHDALERLYHLAKDELFDKHEYPTWKPLPCKY